MCLPIGDVLPLLESAAHGIQRYRDFLHVTTWPQGLVRTVEYAEEGVLVEVSACTHFRASGV